MTATNNQVTATPGAVVVREDDIEDAFALLGSSRVVLQRHPQQLKRRDTDAVREMIGLAVDILRKSHPKKEGGTHGN